MKKRGKIGLVVISLVILTGLFLISSQLQHTISFGLDTQLDEISLQTHDGLLSLDLPLIGSSDASVTIIAFNDYQCSNCKTWYEKEFSEISENIIKTNKANIVFLDSLSVGKDSVLISEATFCANEQEKYLEYQEKLFESQKKVDNWAKSEQLKKFAIDLELDSELFGKCLDSGKYKKTVLSNIDYADSFGVEKIPVFKIINSEGKEHILKGGMPNDVFETIVDQLQ